MLLEAKSCCQDLVAELAFPMALVFNDVRVAIAEGEVDVEVFDGFGYLLLQSSFFLLDLDDVPVGGPVALDIFEALLEEEGQVLGLAVAHGQTLDIDMAVFFGVLLEKDNLHVDLIEGLQQALLVIVDLGEHIFIEPDHRLFVVHWRQDQVEVVAKGLVFRQGQVHVVGRAQQLEFLVIRAKDTVLVGSVGCHNRPISLLEIGLLITLLFVVKIEIILELAFYLRSLLLTSCMDSHRFILLLDTLQFIFQNWLVSL